MAKDCNIIKKRPQHHYRTPRVAGSISCNEDCAPDLKYLIQYQIIRRGRVSDNMYKLIKITFKLGGFSIISTMSCYSAYPAYNKIAKNNA